MCACVWEGHEVGEARVVWGAVGGADGDEGVGPDPAVRVGGGREAAVGLEAGLKGGVQAGAARLEGVAHDVAALANLDG